ncbi:MAG TPA: ATP-binding protein [Spirochaetota bacterium]|nr:ATP-binding protein [Spirochaetota bacterium]
MDIKRIITGKPSTVSDYTSMEILEIRGARIFIGVTATTSAIGLIFQFIAGHTLKVLLPTVFLYTLAVFLAYRLYRRKKRRADIKYYALVVALIMFLIPIIARLNYGITINWFYAAQSNHINWLLMANLVAFQFLYNKRLYLIMIVGVILNVILFYIIAWYNGVPMPFDTYTDGRVNYGILSSREIYSILMMCIVSYLSYRNIPEIRQFDRLTKKQADVIQFQAEEEARKAEEIQSQYEELEAQYEEIEQMNEEMAAAQSEIMEINSSLKMQTEMLSATIRSIAQGIIEVDTKFNVSLINDTAASILGLTREEAKGRNLTDILEIRQSENKKINLADRDFLNGNLNYDFYNSVISETSEGTMDLTLRAAPLRIGGGSVYGYVFVIDDITELKKMKEHIISSSKLESLGIFAGGIAHDINNFFTGMLGCIALAKRNLSSPDVGSAKYLDDAEATALKARGLAEQLLTFSRGGEPVKKSVSIKDILNLSADFVLSGTRVTCQKSFGDDLDFVEADETQISQVISNILINARQAMPDGGNIKINAEKTALSDENIYALPQGEYVEVKIEDEGPGIDESIIVRIFDPFVTTKTNGSGLGLSVAYSVLKKHGGGIRAYNSETGAVFSFVIPFSGTRAVNKKSVCIENLSCSGKVLLLDDDDMIRMVGEELLGAFGFEVISAATGEEAVRLFKDEYTKDGRLRFAILDLTIRGGSGGLEAFKQMKKIDPDLKGIVSSGYSHDPVMSNFADYGFTAILKKPYNFDELRDTISKVIAI